MTEETQLQINEYKKTIEYYEQCLRNIRNSFEIDDSYFPSSIIEESDKQFMVNTIPIPNSPHNVPYVFYYPIYAMQPQQDVQTPIEDKEEPFMINTVSGPVSDIVSDMVSDMVSNMISDPTPELSDSECDSIEEPVKYHITREEINSICLSDETKHNINKKVEKYIKTIKLKTFEGHPCSIFFDRLIIYKTYIQKYYSNMTDYARFRQQRRRISGRVAAFKNRLINKYKLQYLMKEKKEQLKLN